MSDGAMPCPACGGSGGGPFGRAGSAWDLEDYECPRCQGAGVVPLATSVLGEARPLAKGAVRRADEVKRAASGGDKR